MLNNSDPQMLDATFAALADPTRRAVLAQLADKGEATVTELAEPFDMSLPGFSRHLKVLEKAGLIERSRQAQFRPCTINPEPLKEASDWLADYRKLWEARFDRLDALLAELQSDPTQTAKEDHGDPSK
ncbi:transcriptional regulator [Oceaniradius stylonematis]|uniref:Transcriptional regulator n=2 Tax=Oceaniradius stylonematis TaxID=2184161 RepID=A0A3A8AEM2_9HYPH|nr:transcriptional regulator [Oceaniradius stylonematis]